MGRASHERRDADSDIDSDSGPGVRHACTVLLHRALTPHPLPVTNYAMRLLHFFDALHPALTTHPPYHSPQPVFEIEVPAAGHGARGVRGGQGRRCGANDRKNWQCDCEPISETRFCPAHTAGTGTTWVNESRAPSLHGSGTAVPQQLAKS